MTADPRPSTDLGGSLTVTGRLSHPYLLPGTSDLFATLEVRGVDVPGAQRAPVNLALVIDRSGSMAGEKLAQAKRAAAHLVDLLDEHDRLSIVHYGNDVRAYAGTDRFCSNATKVAMKRFIAGIEEEGGTNIGDGLEEGRAQLALARSDFRVNRLLLLSDGQPTVGLTSPKQLIGLVGKIREGGISVTSLGVGADFNEDLMQRLAEVGGGAYGFVSNNQAMASLFERDLNQAGTLVAQGATVRFVLPPGVRLGEVFGRPSTVDAANGVTVSLPDFAAGQTEKVVVRLSVKADGRAVNSSIDIGQFELRYRDLLEGRNAGETVRLAARVTPDGALASARRDKEATVDATRAQAAANFKKAADSMASGDFKAATQAIEANDLVYSEADAVPGVTGAIAADRAENKSMFGLTQAASAAPQEAQRMHTKSLKTRSLIGSGRSSSSVYQE